MSMPASATRWRRARRSSILRVYGSAGLTLTGNELANYLIGGSATTRSTAAAATTRSTAVLGADAMAGGAGNDIYYVDNAGDQVIEAAGGGSDTVYASVDYTLAAGQEVECLRVYGSAGLDAHRQRVRQLPAGRRRHLAGGDTLDGGAGADTMAGGSGNDTYSSTMPATR